MPHVESFIFNKKGIKRKAYFILEEDEKILSCLNQGMRENGISEADVIAIDGTIKTGIMNYLDGSKYCYKNIEGQKVMLANGHFKLSFGDLFGSLRITLDTNPPINGVFSKGTAKEGLKITIQYTDYVDKEKKEEN